MVRKGLSIKSSRMARKRRRKVLGVLFLYAFFFVSLIVGLSFLSYADFLSVNEIKIIGAETINKDRITGLVLDEIEGRRFLFFSASNAFLYPRTKIKDRVLSSDRKIAEANVSLAGLSSISVEIKERQPFGLWCEKFVREVPTEPAIETGDIEISENLEKCFYFDETGFIFAPFTEADADNLLIKYFGQISGDPIGLKFVNNEEHLIHLKKFLFLLSLYGVEVREVFFDAPEVEVRVAGATNIFLDIRDNPEKIFENFITVVEDPEFASKDGLSSFEYIDLRFGNKILYKLKRR